MSKVICDVCGTAYPETADQCPICGCAKPENARAVSADSTADGAAGSTYTYVKGGRFSKANVRKRNKLLAAQRAEELDEDVLESEQDSSGKGLIITIVMLALAIVAVIGYIFLNFFGWGAGNKSTEPAQTTTAGTTTQQITTEDTAAIGIACSELTLATDVITLTQIGEAWLINAIPTPANTTDPVTFVSSNTAVAEVNNEGRVTAVGTGEAVITVTCGLASAECRVTCEIETQPTTEETTQATTEPAVVDGNWTLNRKDFTLSTKGETWVLFKGDISKDLVTFSSDDETVATFEDGVVTAVGKGHTTVRASYGDKELTCMVHCSIKDDGTEPAETETTEPTEEETTEPAPSRRYAVYINGTDVAARKDKNDVTIAPGKTFRLTLVDTETQKAVDVNWNTGDAEVCTVEGSTVTGVAKGNTVITVTVDGKTYECIVRVTG